MLQLVYQFGNSAPITFATNSGVDAGVNSPALNIPAVTTCTPLSTAAPASPCTFQIYRAVYGSNVDGNGFDRTKYFTQCNGQKTCTYTFNYATTGGDPYPGHQKNLVVDYSSNGGLMQTWQSPNGVEAGSNAVVTLSCTAPISSTAPGANVPSSTPTPGVPSSCNNSCIAQCTNACNTVMEMCVLEGQSTSSCGAMTPGCLTNCYSNPSAFASL